MALTQSLYRRKGMGHGNTVLRLVEPVAAATRILRATLGDSNIAGLYVPMLGGLTLSGSTVVSLDDVRGASGFGPQLSSLGTARPTYANGVITFDGVDDYLRATWVGAVGQSCALAYVGSTTPSGSTTYLTTLASGTADHIALAHITGSFRAANASAVASTAWASGVRVLHGRRTGATTLGIRVGSGAETTALGDVGTTPTSLTVGANRLATPGQFSAHSMAALVVYAGDYASGAQYQAVNAFGQYLGATL